MKEQLSHSADPFLVRLHQRFPELDDRQIEKVAGFILSRIAEALANGESIGLARIGEDGLPTELKILDISENGVKEKPSQVSNRLFSDFFVRTST